MCSVMHADHQRLCDTMSPDRRDSPRAVAVFKVVKINRAGVEGFARCRNISESGMRLETAMPLSLNDDLIVELVPGQALYARVVWTKGSECGLTFEGSINLPQALKQKADEKRQRRSRSARLNTTISARIASKGGIFPTTISNISQRGMLVSHDGSFCLGQQVKVLFNNGTERNARVQWTQEHFAGLFLAEPYSVMQLGDLTALG